MNSLRTKYVLSGGYPAQSPDRGRAYIEAIVEGLDTPSVLLCPFARQEVDWGKKRDETEQLFSKWANIKRPIILASRDSFINEIEKHTIIYISGGNTPELYKAFTTYSDNPDFWRERFNGKVIAGSSACVNLLTVLSYNVDHHMIQHGLGLINKASLVHYRSQTYNPTLDWSKVEEELRKQTNLSTLFLKEGEFTVIEQ